MARVFAPPQNPSWSVPVKRSWDVVRQGAAKPYVQTIPRQIRSHDGYDLVWNVCTTKTRDYIVSFDHEMIGPTTYFLWTPFGKMWAPEANDPTVAHVAGGSLGSRTYYARFTWFDPITGLETTPSPATTLAVPANRLLQITLPVLPIRVPAARIYVSSVQNAEVLQGYVTTRTWLEPVTGILTSAPLPPTVNTLTIQRKWRFSAPPQERQLRPGRFTMRCELEEYWL